MCAQRIASLNEQGEFSQRVTWVKLCPKLASVLKLAIVGRENLIVREMEFRITAFTGMLTQFNSAYALNNQPVKESADYGAHKNEQ